MKKVKDSHKDLDHVKDILLNRKKALEEEFAHLHADTDDDQVQDPGDQASSSALETLKSSLQNNEYEEYKMIMNALQMIQDGTYGICSDCQQPISSKRLESYPNAARCLVCQEALEESMPSNGANSYL